MCSRLATDSGPTGSESNTARRVARAATGFVLREDSAAAVFLVVSVLTT
jgi:hypothetical protein